LRKMVKKKEKKLRITKKQEAIVIDVVQQMAYGRLIMMMLRNNPGCELHLEIVPSSSPESDIPSKEENK
jgi:hypothetical protein